MQRLSNFNPRFGLGVVMFTLLVLFTSSVFAQSYDVTDNFDRADGAPGANWSADAEYQIAGNQLTNTSTATTGSWNFIAAYTAQQNPSQVSFDWASNADADGINNGGFALMLDAAGPDANGYLVWRHTSTNNIDIYTVVNGAPGTKLGSTAGALSAPQAGDEFKIVMSSDDGGHHFDIYINNVFDGRVTDAAKQQGNAATLYAGVMLRANYNNDIDNFRVFRSSDATAPAAVSNLDDTSASGSSISLTWTAPGDDGASGTASKYDLRYSTSTITEANFYSATAVNGLPTPSASGATENFTVSGLESDVTYYFALKSRDEVSNTSDISNVATATTTELPTGTVVDDFNRSDLGADWVADADFAIASNELANTTEETGWGYMAVYKNKTNASEVSFRWGAGADATGINSGGLALMLDAASPDANGYLVWRHTSNSNIDVWTIENGAPGQSVGTTTGNLSAPVAGDVFKVIVTIDESGHHFDFYTNDAFDGRVTDAAKRQGTASNLYSGVMLYGGRNNNVDNFTLSGELETGSGGSDTTAPSAISDLATGTTTASSVALSWTAPGDDGTEGTAASYDVRYSTSAIDAGNFSSATPATGEPSPSAAGSSESFTVSGLQENTTYYFAVKTEDESSNVSSISNIESATTSSSSGSEGTTVDNFNRSDLGTNWAADPEYAIENNELANTSTTGTWGFMAVFKPQTNPSKVSIKWGATADATGINSGGLALMLDSASPDANGYLLWRHTGSNYVDLYTIENGAASQNVGRITGSLADPTAGDVFEVRLSSDGSGHHFDCYINGNFDGRISDSQKRQGNAGAKYSGVMLRANLNNNVDDFTVTGETSPDETAPAAISDLAAPSTAETSVLLTWTAPGDDGSSGTASSYDVRYSTSQISDANFASATQASGVPSPSEAGSAESFSVTGLTVGTTYYFAIKTSDDVNNTSAISNVVNATTITDEIPPGAISDLEVGTTTALSAQLTWTAPGGNGTTGQASSYDLRYSTSTLNDLNFESATQVGGTPTPSAPGTLETFNVSDLSANTTYYFALKTRDEAGNVSDLSNVVSTTTTSGVTTVDDFNRSALGSNWTTNGYQIVSDELANTAGDDSWNHLAIFNAKKNPFGVSFKWGAGADATGIDGAGFALMMDATTANANGYLLWRRTTSQKLYLYTIKNGAPGSEVTNVTASLPTPQAGDVFAVVMRTDANGHYFDCYINGQFDGTVSDGAKQQGNSSSQYAGVMSRGNRNNNIDDFTLTNPVGSASILTITGGNNQVGEGGQALNDPLEVTVYDEFNNPQQGIPVTFRVTQGGGTLDGSADTEKIVNSDVNGKAQISFTLGREGEVQYVEASATNLTTVTFTATAGVGVAKKLVYVSGTGQSAMVGTALTQPFVVKVTDQANNPMAGITVNFAITQGSGIPAPSITQSSVQTDANGEASTSLTLGTVSGTHIVQASVSGLEGSPVTFTATATADNATNLVEESGNNQTGSGGSQLQNPFVAKVTDQYGNPKQGVQVTFTVTKGAGSVSDTLVTTDASGLASSFLTLATQTDTNKVEASSPGLQGSPIEFVAYASGGVVDRIVYLSGNNQNGTVNTTLPQPLQVKVVDKNSQGVQNHKVTFSVLPGGGTLNGDTETVQDVFTDAQGVAKVDLTFGSSLGSQIVEANSTRNGDLVPDSPIRFTLTALVPNLVEVSGNGQNGIAGNPLPQPFIVKVADEQGNPIAGQTVTFTVTQGGGTLEGEATKEIVTGEGGTASVIMTLGPVEGQANEVRATALYDGTDLDGSPVVFQATAGEITDLVKVSGDNQLGTAGQPLSNPLKVKVLNDFNVPVASHPVTFSVTQGGGLFGATADTTVLTNSEGIAELVFSLGTTPGDTNKVTVQAFRSGFDLNGSPLEFQAISAGIKEIRGVAGNRQVGLVSLPLELPFKVRIIDELGKTPKGFPVTFKVTEGDGDFTGDSVIVSLTDEMGIAEATMTLGPIAGTENNIAEAIAVYNDNPIAGSPITFIASSIAGPPTKLVYVEGDSQRGAVGGSLIKPLKLQVTDHVGTPKSNHPVIFNITAGDGTLGGESKTTVTKTSNAEGYVDVVWTLGVIAGEDNNTVVATSEYEGSPLQGSPYTFTATALPSPASALDYVSGTEQEGLAGRPLAQPFIVKVKGAKGNGIPGHPVEFKVISGDGNFGSVNDSIRTINTDEQGNAAVILTLGTQSGLENIVHASSVNGTVILTGSPVIFTADSKTGPVDAVVSSIICTPETLMVDISARSIITVTLSDTFGNPIAGKAVTLRSSVEGDILEQPEALTNADGQVFGSITTTLAGLRQISAKDITDGLDLVNKGRVVFSPLDATEIIHVSGGNQQGNIGTALVDPITVKVTDEFGNGISNYPVSFEATEGGGTILEEQPIYTDSTGKASATFILGRTAGVSNVAKATAEGLSGSPVLFTASTLTPQASILKYVSGRSQSGNAGFALPEPFVVKVTDANGLPVWNHEVAFEVQNGNGSFYGETSKVITTDFSGLASAQFVLSREIGNNIAEAKATGLSGSPVSFSAQSYVGEAARLQYVVGNNQVAAVDTELPISLKVKVTDFYGNGISGFPVIFSIKEGDAQLLENQLQNSDVNGFVSISLRLGHTAGDVVVEAEGQDLIDSKITFNLTASSAAPTSIALHSGNGQDGTIGRKLPYPLKVVVKDVHNNPVPNVNVRWVRIDNNGELVDGEYTQTDEDGIAQNELVAGTATGLNTAYAIITGLAGSPVIFGAQGVENKFPLFTEVGDKVINEGNSVSFIMSAVDDDGDPVTYGVRNLPAGAEFDSTGSKQFRWTPDFGQDGEYEVTFLAYDDQGGLGVEFVNITVNNINHKPQITSRNPMESGLTLRQSQNDTVHFMITAFDSDNETLSFSWTHSAFGETVVVSTQRYYDFAAVGNLNGYHEITAHVSDGIDTVSHTWYINIKTIVELVNFTANVAKYKGVQLEWQTGSEENNAGFNVYRSYSKDGVYEKINGSLLPGNNQKTYQYIDTSVETGQSYYYKLEDVDKNGIATKHEAIFFNVVAPKKFELSQNYPNPFNPTTTISYQLPQTVRVSLKIYNIMGQEVKTLVDDVKAAGFHSLMWDGRNSNGIMVPSGIYFYSIQTEGFNQVKRMVLLK